MRDPWEAHIQRASQSKEARQEFKKVMARKQKSPLDIHASRINNGEPVADYYLKGKLKQQLLAETDLTEEDFAKYTG